MHPPYFLYAINLYIQNRFCTWLFCSILTAIAPGLGPHYFSSILLQWLADGSVGPL